jgi:flagellar FliL protein
MGISGTRDEAGVNGKVTLPTFPLLVTVLAGVWIAFATAFAGVYSLAKSGHLPLGKMFAAAQGTDNAPATHAVVLDSILANLADPSGHAYVRLGITLDVANDAASAATNPGSARAGKTLSSADSSVRDTILNVVGQQTSEALLAPDGKTTLKRLLKEAIAKDDPQLAVNDLYFTDFLVQR